MIRTFTIIAFILSLNINAQISKCNAGHIGTFELDSEDYGILKIERTENSQIETNESMGFQASYDVVWIDDCHYELRNKKVIKGETRPDSKTTDIMKAEILKIEGSKVFLRLSSNFSDFITDCEITKIK
ncbi:hypothetical protein [Flavobacterium sp. 5]|uniref:hypothetical protein n=1 Tax=Flavobacterium sp. 5 TaxID=2035199 RepID=UPI000C2CD3D7|nr:hypothetical protein [Flavobacterium sp. 5]PKB17234.1 hypothetical protein CLU82_2419 [Flavobacterium sp. 5]